MASLGREASDLIALARQRPILIVGGGLGLLLLAAAVSRGQGDDAEPEAESDADLGTVEGEADGSAAGSAGSLTFGAGYGLPTYGVDGAGAYDPFTTDQGTQAPAVERTPDGCPLPKPAIPSGLSGQGDWACVNGSWAWRSKGSGAPSSSKRGPRIVIEAGTTFNHYRVVSGRLRGEQRRAGSRVTWATSATPQRMRTYGGSTVRVVQLREGPLRGRWVAVGGAGRRWYPS